MRLASRSLVGSSRLLFQLSGCPIGSVRLSFAPVQDCRTESGNLYLNLSRTSKPAFGKKVEPGMQMVGEGRQSKPGEPAQRGCVQAGQEWANKYRWDR